MTDGGSDKEWCDYYRAETERLTHENRALRSDLARVTAQCEAMREVVDAACELEDNWADVSAPDISSKRLDDAVDAYRRSPVKPEGER